MNKIDSIKKRAPAAGQRRKRHSSPENWPWWKLGALWFVVLSFSGALLAGVPDYSPVALWAAIVLTVGGTISAALAARPGSWWSRLASASTWPLFFLGFGVRGWLAVVPSPWLWLPLAVGGYVLAWALPVIHPKLSAILLREPLPPP